MSDVTYVVVGAGLAAARAVEALRADGVDGRVVMIGEETYLPYERPELSKGYLAGDKERADLTVHDEAWYAAHDVELLAGCRATALEVGSRVVQLERLDGSRPTERLGYDRLLLATGSAPNRLRVPGAGLDGVHYLREVDHSDALKAAIGAGGPLVVIGGGWIGLEAAAVARSQGVDVTVVEAAAAPLARVVGDEIGARFAALHRDHGVDVRTNVQVGRLVGDGRVEGVELQGGTVVPAAAVLVGVGAAPRTELAEQAGLTLAGGGVAVDTHLVSSDPRVWAAGDVAYAQNTWLGGPVRVEHWANANDQGAFAGHSLGGSDRQWDVAPFFFSDQYDTGLEYHGWADPLKQPVVVRELGDGAWTAFWLDSADGARVGRVTAGMHVNGWDDADAVKQLVVDRAVVDPARLGDPQVAWADLPQ
ncbi:NAD(P)/FAD-dependent oxidoreductase [Spongisporangium articulatum]|uniref:NAD(P)/FAD-dependent oxidoreductase n=1 Tax=Spongisporangium articulatum TaxID=3362603 RepID=A0ABW8ALE8_9ACTN